MQNVLKALKSAESFLRYDTDNDNENISAIMIQPLKLQKKKTYFRYSENFI